MVKEIASAMAKMIDDGVQPRITGAVAVVGRKFLTIRSLTIRRR